jgi:hypothetical protein
MIVLRNLLIIAGTSTNTGKTTIACRIISELSDQKITAIKITPHFHEITPGLITIEESAGYALYEETVRDSGKDTSRMLAAGAARVYYVQTTDEKLAEVFARLTKLIPEGSPLVCESPALRNYAEPGAFIIMSSDNPDKKNNINNLLILPHLKLKFEELSSMPVLPLAFHDGEWHMLPL